MGSKERWDLTVRAGPKVERSHYATLDAALDALAVRADDLAPQSRREETRFLRRRYEPAAQIAARLEVAGPGGWRPTVRGGIDLRGDGSMQAYTGRVRRIVVEPERDETAADALRRALAG
jgi:hypothetical protein